jgi:hypothetical protein
MKTLDTYQGTCVVLEWVTYLTYLPTYLGTVQSVLAPHHRPGS